MCSLCYANLFAVRRKSLVSVTTNPMHYRGDSGEMQNYVVRIYRYEKDKPQKLMGIVEKVGEQDKKAFTHFDELWEILNAKWQMPKRKKQDKKTR